MAFRFSLIPREEAFFELYRATTEQIQGAARQLEQMLESEPPDGSRAEVIRDAEHECDTLTHDTIQRLHRTFVTPFDREDLYALATSLDDVMDAIDHAASLIGMYRITVIPEGARELSHLVTLAADRMHAAVQALADRKPVQPHAVEINRLENEADRRYYDSVRALFDSGADALTIMKLKDLLDELEHVTDACEDVANVIEGVVVKHG
jgi:predicted phosphate transport protein (TIGR00153 family)